MRRKNPAQSRRHVLVYMASGESMPVLQSVLYEQNADAEICRDVAELCGKISDQVEAAIVHCDLLPEKTISLMADSLRAQPEWSDLPVLIAVSGGFDSPIVEHALRALGPALVLGYPLTSTAFRSALQIAFRSREKQRRIRDLAQECAQTAQALQESRDLFEQKVRERTNELAERVAQLRGLTGELILNEQNERQRWARVLHDHLQQLLVGAKYQVTPLGRVEDPAVKAAVREIEGLLGEAIEASRSLTSELRPPMVRECGLQAGMEWLVSYMAAQHNLSVQLKIGEDANPTDENARIVLFESIRELLLNVVKHAEVRSAEVSIRRLGNNMLEIVVADQGIGFNPALQKRTGVGFFRIRERLKLIGGRFEIQSAPGSGSRFVIVAPLDGSATAEQPAEADSRLQTEFAIQRPEGPVSGTIRVLIADDHAVMRQGLSSSLSREPDIVIVGEAADGKMALERTRNLRPDVVLMDLGMPKMSGIEATQKIHSEMPKVRVIGLSMFEEKEGVDAMFEAGAVAYLSKTCSLDVLTTAIRRCAGKSELRS